MKNALMRMFTGPSEKPDGPPPPSVEKFDVSEVSDEHSIHVDTEHWLKALEEMRVHNPDAYDHALQYLKRRLSLARRVHLFGPAHSRDFIANASIAQDTKCRTLEELIDDMEKTTSKMDHRERDVVDEVVPAAVQAGR